MITWDKVAIAKKKKQKWASLVVALRDTYESNGYTSLGLPIGAQGHDIGDPYRLRA